MSPIRNTCIYIDILYIIDSIRWSMCVRLPKITYARLRVTPTISRNSLAASVHSAVSRSL